MFCREQVAGFRSRAAELKQAGVGLFFIGNGTPLMAKDFEAYMGLQELTVWTDPRRQTYAHLGFKRGLLSVLDLDVLKNGKRARAAGFEQGKTAGDALQQGGVLVVKPPTECVYGYVSETAGDHPLIDDVVQAALAAAR